MLCCLKVFYMIIVDGNIVIVIGRNGFYFIVIMLLEWCRFNSIYWYKYE